MQDFYSMEQALLRELQELNFENDDDLKQIQEDPLLSTDFDLVAYINATYPDEQVLENIDNEILSYVGMKDEIDKEMRECIR